MEKLVLLLFKTLCRRNLKTQQSPVILNLRSRKTRTGKSHGYHDVTNFEKLPFKTSSVHTKTLSRRFQIPPIWRTFSWRINVDGRPNRRNKAAFLISTALCRRRLIIHLPMHLWSAAKTSWQPPLSNSKSLLLFSISCKRAGEIPSKSSFRLCSESFLLQKP